jgi:hypothetical protein
MKVRVCMMLFDKPVSGAVQTILAAREASPSLSRKAVII